jgi:hypothetical protein
MGISDWLRLTHPILAVTIVFPLIGMVVNFAWQPATTANDGVKVKSKIPPVVGVEHVKLGRWLTGAVVGLALIGLGNPFGKILLTTMC